MSKSGKDIQLADDLARVTFALTKYHTKSNLGEETLTVPYTCSWVRTARAGTQAGQDTRGRS